MFCLHWRFSLSGSRQHLNNTQESSFQDCQVNILKAEWLTVLLFLPFKIPTTDADLSVLASTPNKSSAELEDTKVALKELQRHFETYKAERTQAEE